MIILRKKNIIVVFALIVILIAFTILLWRKKLTKNTIETVALPITNKVIVIDAGHGKPDERSSK